LRLYSIAGSLVVKGGRWCTEMGVIFPQTREIGSGGMNTPTKDSIPRGFQCNECYSIQEEGILEVLLNFWVAAIKGWMLVH
jgi:hypothetical protein